MPEKKKRPTLDHDWDPEKWVMVRNKTANNILLSLPSGYFRLDAGRTFRMTTDIGDVPQVKELVAAGQIEISKK